VAYGIDRTHIARGIISYRQGGDERVTQCALTAEGACLGISSWWIIKQAQHKLGRPHSQDFWDWYETDPKAIHLVRSVMQNQRDVIEKGTEKYRATGMLSSSTVATNKLRPYINFILNNSGFNVLGNKRGLVESPQAVAWGMLANDIENTPGFSLISFATPKQQLNFVGHAVATIVSENGNVDFMDPNIGEFRGLKKGVLSEFFGALKMAERYDGATVKYSLQTLCQRSGYVAPTPGTGVLGYLTIGTRRRL